MMGPSAIGAQPPPEYPDEEWLMMQEDEEGDEPFCTCSTGHGIEETDWNQCDSCGKPIYDEEPAVPPAPTFADAMAAKCHECGLVSGFHDKRCRGYLVDPETGEPIPTHNAALSGAEPASSAERPLEGTVRGENPGKDEQ